VALKSERKPVPEFAAQSLFKSSTIAIRDVYCQGSCRHQSAEECATTTEVVFPYRGVYVRHLGHDQAVAEANQVLFFNASEGYRVSHPVPGGDASLSLAISEPQLRELAPPTFLRDGATLAFRRQRLRIDARTQALVALLRHGLRQNIAEPLEAEGLALTLVQRALGPRTRHIAGASVGRQRLVDRVKLVLERSGTTMDVGRHRGGSARLPSLSHAGFPTGGRPAFVPLPVAVTASEGAGSSRAT